MVGERLFNAVVSGGLGPVGDVARTGLSALSKLYTVAVTRRNRSYDKPGAVYDAGVPTISVGNITVGGTGKTPMVSYVCDRLAQAGRHPAIISRGYRAEDNKNTVLVSEHGHIEVGPEVSGDEAWLLANQLPTTSVLIGRQRTASAQLAVETLGADTLVMDDGFQHRALGRDLDIVLIDATNPFGYGYVLPRGLLREPLTGLKRADIFVITKVNQATPQAVEAIQRDLRTWCPETPIVLAAHATKHLYRLVDWEQHGEPLPLDALVGKKVLAASGIGRPASFANTLRTLSYDVVGNKDFGDHHQFTEDDVVSLWIAAFGCQAEAIVVTEKDAVKLATLLHGKVGDIPIYVVTIGIEIVEGQDVLDQAILSAGRKR